MEKIISVYTYNEFGYNEHPSIMNNFFAQKRIFLIDISVNYRPQRSCEGYVFTRVCQSFCSQGGEVCYPSMHCRWYPSMPCSRGMCSGGCLLQGVPALGGVETPLKADGYCCGQYASYWNAFLLNTSFTMSTKCYENSFFKLSYSF